MATLGKVKSAARRALAVTAGGVLRHVPVSGWTRLAPKDAVGLCYHMVSERKLAHLRHYPFLTPRQFENDLAYVGEHFGFLSYDELARRRAGARVLRANEAILTFDDGFAECAEVVAPILKKRGIPCTFFLITDLIGNRVMFRESTASLCIEAILTLSVEETQKAVDELGIAALLKPSPARRESAVWVPLDVAFPDVRPDPALAPLLHWLLTISPGDTQAMEWLAARLGVDASAYVQDAKPYLSSEQVGALAADGFTIGAHGLSHRRLQSLSRDEAEREIVESCRLVAQMTGRKSVPFAFPYYGGDIDREWLKDLRARHDVIGLFFDTDGLREDSPHVVQRVFSERTGRDGSLDAILRRAWARPSAWRRLKGPAETKAAAEEIRYGQKMV
jgi:peptidoglycan/xylan/chitin deacetylase (PgdA/CDA1 family)